VFGELKPWKLNADAGAFEIKKTGVTGAFEIKKTGVTRAFEIKKTGVTGVNARNPTPPLEKATCSWAPKGSGAHASIVLER
jgi:hypothetical protein